MRIWVISDLHLDAMPWSMNAPEHDVLVIAGDVTSGGSPRSRLCCNDGAKCSGITAKAT